jgi:SprT protein
LVVCAKWGYDVSAHGEEWRSVMRQFGCEPLTTHDYDVSKARIGGTFFYRCACKTHELSVRRHNCIARGQRWQCLRCQAELVRVTENEELAA